MKFAQRLAWSLISGLFALSPSLLSADCFGGPDETVLIREYINSRRRITMDDKCPAFRLSGDVRGQWNHRIERRDGKNVRGGRDAEGNLLAPYDNYNGAFNLRIDNKWEETWMHMHLACDNTYGIDSCDNCPSASDALSGSGVCTNFCLKRAYWGINVWKGSKPYCEGVTFAIEVGRRPLSTIFDSRIEFQARFDGILFKLLKSLSKTSELYFNLGTFAVDFPVNHFAYVYELGYLDVLESRIDAKYSYIDWSSWLRENRCKVQHPRGWDFQVTQLALAYNIRHDILNRKARLYSAFLINGAARNIKAEDIDSRVPRHNFGKKNIGWYFGFVIGEVKKKGDWSIDTNYQYVEQQAIPEIDMQGISLGNVNKDIFIVNGRGKANYRGWKIQFLYKLLEKVSLDTSFEIAKSLTSTFPVPFKPPAPPVPPDPPTPIPDPAFSGRRFYSKFELVLIYAF